MSTIKVGRANFTQFQLGFVLLYLKMQKQLNLLSLSYITERLFGRFVKLGVWKFMPFKTVYGWV